MGHYKDALTDYLETVIMPSFKNHDTLAADEWIELFNQVQDQLLDNGKVTISARSSATNRELTFTYHDLEQYTLNN